MEINMIIDKAHYKMWLGCVWTLSGFLIFVSQIKTSDRSHLSERINTNKTHSLLVVLTSTEESERLNMQMDNGQIMHEKQNSGQQPAATNLGHQPGIQGN